VAEESKNIKKELRVKKREENKEKEK